MWKSTEFIVLPHRDSKDVFILGGTDDIQVLLDDSQVSRERKGKGRRGGEREEGEGIKRIQSSLWQIFFCRHNHHYMYVNISPILLQVNISTIAGSRHVGPIKSRVDEWGKQLNLFSETLVGTVTHTFCCM